RIDLMGYLFGDLLSVNNYDVMFIYMGAAVVMLLLVAFWRPLLSSTVNEELAAVEGVNISLMRLLIMLMIGLVIAVGMKFVGALIISSLLIIPAATARRLCRSPEQMAIMASIIGMICVCTGLS
ncbi:iron chelate uptake ABC transporter family permease subunit, partial [Vibrio sp. 10N.222.49.C9]